MQTKYRLQDGVQVRNETFGLLFYHYGGPRLYFVPCQDLLDSSLFEGQLALSDHIDTLVARHSWPRPWVEAKIEQVLHLLREKGLIHG